LQQDSSFLPETMRLDKSGQKSFAIVEQTARVKWDPAQRALQIKDLHRVFHYPVSKAI
jgi:hypothetical protein